LQDYFLKLSSISCATSFHHSQNASHPAMEIIDINHIRIVVVISEAIQILSNTTIKVKNNIIILAQLAITFAVFCFDRSRVWKTIS